MATVNQGNKMCQGMFTEMWQVKETVDFANAAVGSGTFASVDVTVPNVVIGDMVLGISVGVDTVLHASPPNLIQPDRAGAAPVEKIFFEPGVYGPVEPCLKVVIVGKYLLFFVPKPCIPRVKIAPEVLVGFLLKLADDLSGDWVPKQVSDLYQQYFVLRFPIALNGLQGFALRRRVGIKG